MANQGAGQIRTRTHGGKIEQPPVTTIDALVAQLKLARLDFIKMPRGLGRRRFVGLMAAAGGAGGLLIGLMMDNSREGRVLVYERKPPARAIILAPLLSKSGVGLGMSIPW